MVTAGDGKLVVAAGCGAEAVILQLARLMLGLLAHADVNEELGTADDVAECCLACLHFRAAVSHRSSTVLNWAQVRSWNCQINWPNSVVM